MEGAPIAYKRLAEPVLAATPLYLCHNPKDRDCPAGISRSAFLLFSDNSLTILRMSREKKGKGSNEERIQFDTISCDIQKFPNTKISELPKRGPVYLTVPQFHVDMPAFLACYNRPEGVTSFLARLPSPSDWEERKEDREKKTLVYVSAWYRIRQSMPENQLRQLVFLPDQRHFVTFHTKAIFQWCLEVENRYVPILPITESNTDIVYGGTYGDRQLVFSVAGSDGKFHLYALDMSMAMTFGPEDLIPVDQSDTLTLADICETIDTGDEDTCLFWWKRFDNDYVLCLESKRGDKGWRYSVSIRKIDSAAGKWDKKAGYVLPISFGGSRQLPFPCDPCDILQSDSHLKCCVGIELKTKEDGFEVFTVQFKRDGDEWKEDGVWQSTIDTKVIHKCRRTERIMQSDGEGKLLTFVRFLEKEWNQLLALHKNQLYQIHPPAKGSNR